MKSRATFDFDGNNYRFRMEMSPDGANWMPIMEGTYARQSARATTA